MSKVLNLPTLYVAGAATRGKHNRPRYAFVRNIEMERDLARQRVWHDAAYDIVDNGEGSECVMARGVHYRHATVIVGALNMLAEAARIGDTNETEVPPTAA